MHQMYTHHLPYYLFVEVNFFLVVERFFTGVISRGGNATLLDGDVAIVFDILCFNPLVGVFLNCLYSQLQGHRLL